MDDLISVAALTKSYGATRALDGLLARLSAIGVRGLTCSPPSLEDLFLRHYQGAAR
ncbi:hypothetical protein [Nonomuraea jabiensis]|uniref:hypothetical protein n=1 Tax=Nonomuraea jabiensis TaxID=882448 RepID=UPI0036B45615